MKNKYKIIDDKVIIYLETRDGQVFEAIIDVDDLDKVKQENLKWHVKYSETNSLYYCKATKYLGIINGKYKYKTIYLSQIILGFYGRVKMIDHKNHNPLDNRKDNLRLLNNKQNVTHRKGANKNTTTGVRNVSYSRLEGKYLVQLQIEGKINA